MVNDVWKSFALDHWQVAIWIGAFAGKKDLLSFVSSHLLHTMVGNLIASWVMYFVMA